MKHADVERPSDLDPTLLAMKVLHSLYDGHVWSEWHQWSTHLSSSVRRCRRLASARAWSLAAVSCSSAISLASRVASAWTTDKLHFTCSRAIRSCSKLPLWGSSLDPTVPYWAGGAGGGPGGSTRSVT